MSSLRDLPTLLQNKRILDFQPGYYYTGMVVVNAGSVYRANADLGYQATFIGANWTLVATATGSGSITKTDVVNTGVAPIDIGAISMSGGGAEKVVIETSVSGTYTPDLTRGNYFVLNITGNVTIGMPTVVNGYLYSFTIHVIQGGSGGFTYSWDPKIAWKALQQPQMAMTAGGDDLLSFVCEGDNLHWLGLHHTAQLAIGSTYLDFTASSEPGNPASGTIRLWFDTTTQQFLWKDYTGTKHQIGTSAPPTNVITQVSGQVASGKNFSAVGTYSQTLPSNPTTGNMLIVVAATDYTGGIVGPSGWTTDLSYSGSQSIGTVAIFRKTVASGEPRTATVTFSGTHFCYMSLIEYTGQASSPVDQTASNQHNNTSTSVTVTTGATAQASELAICGFLSGGQYDGSGVVGWGSSGFATIYDSGLAGAGAKTLSTTGAVTATPTVPGTNQYLSGIVVTYKAA